MKDYVKIVYNEHERPITKYPEQLTEYLFYRFKMKKEISYWIMDVDEVIFCLASPYKVWNVTELIFLNI
jgi:hypothetical protein